MLGIILLLLFLFSRLCFSLFGFFCPQPWRKRAAKHAEGSWRGTRRGSVKAILMRLYQRENTQGAGLEKNQKSLSWEDSQSSHIPHTIFVCVLYLYLHRVLTSSSTPFLLLCLPSPALSHLNTYAYLIWHGFDFDFGFDFSLCLGCSSRNW